MSFSVTGLASGYRITRSSHYRMRQAYFDPLTGNEGLGQDYEEIMSALNEVEEWLGISKTTWDSTMGSPLTSDTMHQCVYVGGDSDQTGFLRDAVDRLRSAGGVAAWTWLITPGAETYADNWGDKKNGVSILHVLELKMAVGRIVNPEGGAWGVGHLVLRRDYRPRYQNSVDDKNIFWAEYTDHVHEGFRLEAQPVFEMYTSWATQGRFIRGRTYERDEQFLTGYPDPSPRLVADVTQIWWPGIRPWWGQILGPNESGEHSDQFAAKAGGLTVYIFRNNTDGSGSSGRGYEDIETRHTDLWELVDDNGTPTTPADPITFGSINDSIGISKAGGVCNTVGPHRVRRFYYGGGYGTYNYWSGEFPIDNTDWQMVAAGAGYVNGQAPYNYLSSGWLGWAHNSGETRDPDSIYPDPAPTYASSLGGTPDDHTQVGAGAWHHSNDDPLRGIAGNLEGASELQINNYYATLHDRLFLEAAEFDPAVTSPKKYVWCVPNSGVDVSEFVDSSSPGVNFVPNDIYQAFIGATNTVAFNLPDPPAELNTHEWYVTDEVGARANVNGWIHSKKFGDVSPTGLQSSGGSWLVWTGANGANGSPFEECVTKT